MPMSTTITRKSTKPPLLKINFLSHGTLESRDLQVSRRFYEEVLGLDVGSEEEVRTAYKLLRSVEWYKCCAAV